MSSSFEFIQGNERLDWGVLVAIDVQRLTRDTNVETLQRIIENIAFSHITHDEAAMFSPDHILHLFKLTQIIIQYLVFSQECLAKQNMRLNTRVEDLQHANDALANSKAKLTDERDVLKKEVKAQRRTLLAYEYHTTTPETKNKAVASKSGTNSNTPPMTFVCSTCGERYHKSESLQSHVRKRHGIPAPQKRHANGPTIAVPAPSPATPPDSLRQEVELHRMQERLEQLEKKCDATSQQQHDQMIQLLLQQISDLKTSLSEKNNNLQVSTVQLQQPLTGTCVMQPPPPATSEMAAPSPTQNPAVRHGNVLSSAEDLLSTIPVVPDLAAMTEYNLSRQRQTETNTLVRQMQEIEKELRELKQVAAQEKPCVERKSDATPTPFVAPPVSATLSKSPNLPTEANDTTSTTSLTSIKKSIRVPYSSIPVQPPLPVAAPAPTSNATLFNVLPLVNVNTATQKDEPNSQQATLPTERSKNNTGQQREYSINSTSSTSSSSRVQGTQGLPSASGFGIPSLFNTTSLSSNLFPNSTDNFKTVKIPEDKVLSSKSLPVPDFTPAAVLLNEPSVVASVPAPPATSMAPIPMPIPLPMSVVPPPTTRGEHVPRSCLDTDTNSIVPNLTDSKPNQISSIQKVRRQSLDLSDSDDTSS